MFTDTVASTEGDRDKLLLCNGLFLTSFAPNSLDSQTETIVVNQCHDITVTLDNRLPRTLPIVRCTLVLRSNNSANLSAFSRSPVPVSENFFMDVSGGGGVSRVPLLCTATIAKTEAGVSVPWVKCTSPHSGSRSYRSESFDVANATNDLTIECHVAELTPGSQELTFTHQVKNIHARKRVSFLECNAWKILKWIFRISSVIKCEFKQDFIVDFIVYRFFRWIFGKSRVREKNRDVSGGSHYLTFKSIDRLVDWLVALEGINQSIKCETESCYDQFWNFCLRDENWQFHDKYP